MVCRAGGPLGACPHLNSSYCGTEVCYIARGMGPFSMLPLSVPRILAFHHTDVAKRKTPLTTEGIEGLVRLGGFRHCYYQSFLLGQGDGKRPALLGYSL